MHSFFNVIRVIFTFQEVFTVKLLIFLSERCIPLEKIDGMCYTENR